MTLHIREIQLLVTLTNEHLTQYRLYDGFYDIH